MLFNSIDFLIFFPIVTAVYFILPHKYRWMMLLAASCYFYMSFIPVYILILFFTIIVNYFTGILMADSSGKKRKIFLIISIMVNVGVLFIFKYFNFFNYNIAILAKQIHWNYSLQALNLILPIGLSFHTFQSLAYSIEVYRGKFKPEKNILMLALYVMFYPQLMAGPIERPQNLLPQFRQKHSWDGARVWSGLERMLWGLFKKIIIADTLADYVNSVYSQAHSYPAPSLVIVTIFFGFQIYCDFSGYTDIALGAAKVMGFKLMENFDRPFTSRSIAEFWRRWHISLSSWFQDYVFTPLYFTFNRSKRFMNLPLKKRHLYSFIISTLIGVTLLGLWHGASWTYVVFGLYHSIMIIFYHLNKKWWDRFPSFIQIFSTFFIFSFSWILFRSNSLKLSLLIVHRIFAWWNYSLPVSLPEYISQNIYLGSGQDRFLWTLAGICLILIMEMARWKKWLKKFDFFQNLWSNRSFNFIIHWFLISTAILIMMVFSKTNANPFIYFQF
jgi:alginate O-acetyltransferase complex protein AlgI